MEQDTVFREGDKLFVTTMMPCALIEFLIRWVPDICDLVSPVGFTNTDNENNPDTVTLVFLIDVDDSEADHPVDELMQMAVSAFAIRLQAFAETGN